MKKNFLSAILLGAFMVASTVTFESCKDYDDDIDNLQEQITSNKDAIAAIEAQIKGGQWVSNVTSTTNGITLTLGNGQSYNITNGKDGTNGTNGTNGKDGTNGTNGKDGTNGTNGKDGVNGLTPQILVADGSINVSYDNGATSTKLIDLKDLKGKDGATPVFTVGDDGHLYVQYADDATTKKDLGISISGIYYVENGISLEIHMPKQSLDGTSQGYGVIKLPRAAAITNIEALGQYSGFLQFDDASIASVSLYYGTVQADVEFNGKTYTRGEFLSSSNGQIAVKINPTIADASLYNFYLTDSKGDSPYVIKKVEEHKSTGPITRSVEPTANKGLYLMTVGYPSDFKVNQLPQNSNIAYCIATKDFYGNELLSKYDLRVSSYQQLDGISNSDCQVEIGDSKNLDEALSGHAVDWVYSYEIGQTAKAEALGVSLSGKYISASRAGSIPIKVSYLRNDGTTGTSTITVTFVPKATTGAISDFVWTMTSEPNKNSVKVQVDALKDYLASGYTLSPSYEYANGKSASDYNGVYAYTGISSMAITTETDNMGYVHYYATLTFNPSSVVPATHIGSITFPANGNLPSKTVKFNVIVNNATTSFAFQTLDAFFNADKTQATAYGIPNGTTIDYDLYNLFRAINSNDKQNISFSESVPQPYNVGNVQYTANPWIASGSVFTSQANIVVDKQGVNTTTHKFGGAYYARAIKATYTPFGNINAAKVNIQFNLTIKSEIAEGTLSYIKRGANNAILPGDIKEIDGATSTTLTVAEILGKDVYGAPYSFATNPIDTRIDSYAIVLGDQNAKDYLNISSSQFGASGITISKKANSTAIVTPPLCNVTVKITDKWGKVTSVNVPVKVMR